ALEPGELRFHVERGQPRELAATFPGPGIDGRRIRNRADPGARYDVVAQVVRQPLHATAIPTGACHGPRSAPQLPPDSMGDAAHGRCLSTESVAAQPLLQPGEGAL